jgi:hypothetical protein
LAILAVFVLGLSEIAQSDDAQGRRDGVTPERLTCAGTPYSGGRSQDS